MNKKSNKPLVSVVMGAYNEGAILENSMNELCSYMQTLEDQYDWEIIVVNDGSSDNTGALLELLSEKEPRIKVFHHRKNGGLGKALQTGFAKSQGKYVVTTDLDLCYSTEHIKPLIEKIEETGAKVVIASPMMKGGKISNVPAYRKLLSVCANKFLSIFTKERITCLTSMQRVYDGRWIRGLSLRSTGMEIMPEIIYKTMIMQGPIVEIPAHLNWGSSGNTSVGRKSSMKIFSHTLATLLTGFLLRPILFFILPGLLLLLFSLYPITWMFIHFFEEYGNITASGFLNHASQALELSYQKHPHTLIVGLFSLLLAIQLIAFGFQSLQSKHYFEELFHLGSETRRSKE